MSRIGRLVVVLTLTMAAVACGDVNAALQQLSEACDLSANLRVEFARATDAANRAVMADTDEQSTAFAVEADRAKQAVEKDLEALRQTLQSQHYSDETALLRQFVNQFAEYQTIDRQVLELAVENTNLKAQRLSFGPALQAADKFRDALEASVADAPAPMIWQAKALAATAVSAVREIQALQAPHIADPDDASMALIEKRMAAAEASARQALRTIAKIVLPASRTPLATATAELDQFMAIHSQILVLSHRNTNVRSLALSLDEKRRVTAPCEESLRALQDALNKRRYTVARWK